MDRSSLVRAHLASGPVEVRAAGTLLLATPKVFASGSLGWHAQSKVLVNDTKCQLNLIITVVGSKGTADASAYHRVPTTPPPMLPGEQNGTMPEKPPEAPQDLFEPEPFSEITRKPRKRSKG